ncbi:MAG: ABC transporter permease subunit [Clostridia bacterium]|nr:ABC transporter permease subunit [Clostridia bacterium]
MNHGKQYRITTGMGLLLILCGYLTNRFLIVKPNRILEGTVINMPAVIKDKPILFTAFFLLLAGMIFIISKEKIKWYFTSAVVTFVIILFLYGVGLYSQEVITDFTQVARVSLSIGFWFVFLGLMIVLDSSCHYDGNFQVNRLIGFLGIILFFIFVMLNQGYFDQIGIIKEMHIRNEQYWIAVKGHLLLSLIASLMGLFIGVLLSYIGYKHKKYKKYFILVSNGAQVIPTLSFLGLLMIPLTLLAKKYAFLKVLGISGIGYFPALIVLTSYTLLPIINQSITGFETISRDVIISAEAMGMKPMEVFWRIEFPLALPGILSGFKIALVQSTANCILAGLVGGGGLGALLFLGLAQSASDLVALSALTVVMMAMILNGILSVVIGSMKKRKGFI